MSWSENATLLFLDQISKKEPTLAGLIFGAQNGEKIHARTLQIWPPPLQISNK